MRRARPAAALMGAMLVAMSIAPSALAAPARQTPSSTAAAYSFLDLMMDKYATGHTRRLVQSFQPQPALSFTASVTYDDALTIDAYLARGKPTDLRRAAVIGDALLYVQAHDPAGDGRVRGAYAPAPLTRPSRIAIVNATTNVGSMAWIGMALTRLGVQTAQPQYLAGAVAIGDWIQSNAADTRGAGGYTGGQAADGSALQWKSTEHNLDIAAFFGMLATATGDSFWLTRADAARHFVESMWDAADGRFVTGTGTDGVTVNDDARPEDVNSWSYLVLRDPAYAAALDWDRTHLAARVDGFNGVSVCQGDRRGVWFEGTAHLATALALRNAPGDAARARSYLATIRLAQTSGPNADGRGIIAASTDKLSDCEGGSYFASLHTGATAWFLLAASATNPFTLPGT